MIPRIIHYCWLSNEPIPDEMRRFLDQWKKLLPDYQFILWDFNRFPKESSAWVSEAFERKKYAFAADYIRLYALYHMGGIYLDLDVELLRPFDPLLNQKRILGFEQEKSIEGGILGAEPGAKWVWLCLQHYNQRRFVDSQGQCDTLPLPQILFNTLVVHGDDMHDVLPVDYLTAKSYKDGKIKVTANTYTIHHFKGSWLTPWQKFKMSLKPLLSRLGLYNVCKTLVESFGL